MLWLGKVIVGATRSESPTTEYPQHSTWRELTLHSLTSVSNTPIALKEISLESDRSETSNQS